MYTLYVLAPPPLFARHQANLANIEAAITSALEAILKRFRNCAIRECIICLSPKPSSANTSSARRITRLTRKAIRDELVLLKYTWFGDLSEIEFLNRLYDLKSLPSKDSRYPNAEGDIQTHRISFPGDWEDGWIFNDERFQLDSGPDRVLLQFLCEGLHPAVRRDQDECQELERIYNKHLRPDNHQILAVSSISGRPIFDALPLGSTEQLALASARSVQNRLNDAYIGSQIARIEQNIDKDPEAAIGYSKEFIETVCKAIIQRSGGAPATGHDLPKLAKQALDSLPFLPDHLASEDSLKQTIKSLAGSLTNIVQSLGTIRNSHGIGHGKALGYVGLEARHARFAVGVAASLALFMVDSLTEESGPPPLTEVEKVKENDPLADAVDEYDPFADS